jgi:hypothetical protein
VSVQPPSPAARHADSRSFSHRSTRTSSVLSRRRHRWAAAAPRAISGLCRSSMAAARRSVHSPSASASVANSR